MFSSGGAVLPFDSSDYRTRQVALSEENFHPALLASCSIPFMLRAVHDIPGAPAGAYWDGGITDYHLHLNYAAGLRQTPAGQGAPDRSPTTELPADPQPLVLYPHFQRAVVPGWLDKGLRWRHKATRFLDNVLLLAPSPQWVRGLPNGKLPDRNDFMHYRHDLAGRIKAWSGAASAAQQLADEFADWLRAPDLRQISPL